jgi:hypothetical protein
MRREYYLRVTVDVSAAGSDFFKAQVANRTLTQIVDTTRRLFDDVSVYVLDAEEQESAEMALVGVSGT